MSETKRVQLTGRWSALLAGATFALDHWPLPLGAEKAGPAVLSAEQAERLARSVSEQWRTHLEEQGLWRSANWTDSFIARRSATVVEFSMPPADWANAVKGLRACASAYSGDWAWKEFCIAMPGDLGRYGLEDGDLARLADRLEEELGSSTISAGENQDYDDEREKVRLVLNHYRDLMTREEKLSLKRPGAARVQFESDLARRILKEQGHLVNLNRCPKCGKIPRTPRAPQCPWCFHTWKPSLAEPE